MGWRFRKRIKIFPGFYINISKSGLGVNIGPKGANVSLGPNGTYVNTGIPGTGLYRRDKVDSSIHSSTEIWRGQEVTPNVDKDEYGTESGIPEDYTSARKDLNHTLTEIAFSSPIPVNQEDNQGDIYNGDISVPYDPKKDLENYCYPPLDLLRKYDFDDKPYIDMEEQTVNKNRIVDTLRSFGIEISSIKAIVGPRITLYEIIPAPGISVSKMRGLEDDIALALCSHDVHIIAPIPCKGTIGIEVPNIRPTIVSMESILCAKYFQESTMDLPCAIGKTVTNEIFMFDLSKAPHVLIGGSTGQGKSVAINAIITSLLYKKHPAEMKLVLMDPSGLELSPYSWIANHFLALLPDQPTIVSNSSQAITVLDSLCKEMDARYELLIAACERNVKDYNKKFRERRLNPKNGHRFMPYIVVIIDEYGDFIEEGGAEIELPIIRLAKFARAVGIHMIISTKRPTNDIVTGAIKSNFPTRISFRVPERIDSQVILDCNGAEELLGNGDMLYRAGKSIDCVRIQGAFVDTAEVAAINKFISQQQGYPCTCELPEPMTDGSMDGGGGEFDVQHIDPLFEDAARLVVMSQSGSTSLIQRKYAIGYNRAGRLMDQLEKAGIVGQSYGSHPREVLIMDEASLENLLSHLR